MIKYGAPKAKIKKKIGISGIYLNRLMQQYQKNPKYINSTLKFAETKDNSNENNMNLFIPKTHRFY